MFDAPTVHGHYIDGKEILEGEIKERRNPADTRQVVANYHDGTPDIANQAVAAARAAFPKWAGLTRRDRAEVIFRAAAKIDTSEWRRLFEESMIDEIGKTTAGARGETEKTRRILSHMAGLGTHTPDDVIHADQAGVHMFTTSRPVGVAVPITPFNFPLAVPAWKIAPALVAGCAVVLKPAPAAPRTSALLVKLLTEAISETPAVRNAKIGPGVINLVYGGGDVAKALIENPDVQAVSFTGSSEVGKTVYRLAANREPWPLDPRHFLAEMGGKNAEVVLDDADLDKAVEAAINGAFFGEGQRCTATSRLVLQESIYDDFMRRFVARTAQLKIGPGIAPDSEVGPLVSEEALQRTIDAVRQSVANGMNLVYGGNRLMHGVLNTGNFMEPTILAGDPYYDPGHLALREELFAPVVGVCRVEDLDAAINVVNKTVEHRHAASLFTSDIRSMHQFEEHADVGMIHINNGTIGGDAQGPFGAYGGQSSLGPREMGLRCMDLFLRDKTVDENRSSGTLARGAR